jgi:hypothetical protein
MNISAKRRTDHCLILVDKTLLGTALAYAAALLYRVRD